MENKKTIIGIIILLILIIGIVVFAYSYNKFNSEQMKLLSEESNKILQSNIVTENVDFNIKTKKNYAIVEKAIKEYVANLKNTYQNAAAQGNPYAQFNLGGCYLQGIGVPVNKSVAKKYFEAAKRNGHERADEIIKEYKDKSQNCVDELEKLVAEESISENINNKSFSSREKYYKDLYNTVMLSDAMKSQYSSLKEKVKDEKSKLNEKVSKIEKIKNFLENNKDAWEIKDDKIQFNNLNRMTEYYGLLNQLVD